MKGADVLRKTYRVAQYHFCYILLIKTVIEAIQMKRNWKNYKVKINGQNL